MSRSYDRGKYPELYLLLPTDPCSCSLDRLLPGWPLVSGHLQRRVIFMLISYHLYRLNMPWKQFERGHVRYVLWPFIS